MAFPWLKVVSVFLFLIGASVLIIGVVLTPRYLPKYVDAKLRDYLVIDSNTSEQYVGWAYGADYKNPYYLVLYMYNLTNPDEVVAGGTPNYTNVGPYMYRRYRASVGVSFPDNGNQIQFLDYVRYEYDVNASNGLSDTDVFLNINPAYVGGLMQATMPGNQDSEVNMLLATVGAMVGRFIPYFTGPAFTALYTSYALPTYFAPAMQATIDALNQNNDTDAATNMFIDTWRNATTPPAVGNWAGLLLVNQANSTAPGISFDSAEALLNPAVSFSLLDTSIEATYFWYQASTNAAVAQNLTTAFGITNQQLALILNWRANIFAPTVMYPQVIAQYQLGNMSDIGWVQFASQEALGGNSINDFPGMASLGYYTNIELNSNELPWQAWKQVWTAFSNITTWQGFMVYANFYPAGDFSPWGLTAATAQTVLLYAGRMIGSQIRPSVFANMGPYGGLFVAKSVYDWTFHCDDYLLNMLKPNPPLCSFRFNDSVYPLSIIDTGKDDLSKVNTYVMWQMQPTVYGWQEPMNASGHTELGQFTPHLDDFSSPPPMPVFQEDLIRTVWLNYTGDSKVEGIETYRYKLDFNSTFDPNPFYYQQWTGLANMSYFLQSPVFLSLWEMLGVEGATSMVNGLNPTNEYNDSTIIDIEPITGKAVQSRKRLQVNVYMPNANQAFFGEGSVFGNTNVKGGIFYPIVKIGEYGTISQEQADVLKDRLSLEPRIRSATFYAGVTAGPALVVIAVLLFALSMRKKVHYEEIKMG